MLRLRIAAQTAIAQNTIVVTDYVNTNLSDEQLRQQLTSIASRFQIFECDKCAEAIKKLLTEKGLRGKQIKLFTGCSEDPYGNIYHEVLQQNIATNGQHQGIAVEIEEKELVFDNIEHQGIPRETWINNL